MPKGILKIIRLVFCINICFFVQGFGDPGDELYETISLLGEEEKGTITQMSSETKLCAVGLGAAKILDTIFPSPDFLEGKSEEEQQALRKQAVVIFEKLLIILKLHPQESGELMREFAQGIGCNVDEVEGALAQLQEAIAQIQSLQVEADSFMPESELDGGWE